MRRPKKRMPILYKLGLFAEGCARKPPIGTVRLCRQFALTTVGSRVDRHERPPSGLRITNVDLMSPKAGLTTRATRRHRAASHRWEPAPMISQTRSGYGPESRRMCGAALGPVTHFSTPCQGSSAGDPRAREATSRRRPEPAWQAPMRQWSPLQWPCCPEL